VPLPEPLDYQADQDLCQGVRVKVPLGRREVIGMVVGQVDSTSITELKSVIEVIDDQPIWSEVLFLLAKWLSHYYQGALGEVICTMMPPLMRKGSAVLGLDQLRYYQACHQPALSAAQKRLVSHVNSCGAIDVIQALDAGFKLNTWQLGIDNGWLIPANRPSQSPTPLALNAEQAKVVKGVQSASGFAPTVLEGVTGSGKTWVYAALIQWYFTQQQQVLILVPEIGLTPQTINRLTQHVGGRCVVMHSAMSDQSRQAVWSSVKLGLTDVVIGTRSALFLPFKHLGLILVDEAHDGSYKQGSGVRYHARDVAVKLAQLHDIPIVMGTATPSLSMYHAIDKQRFLHAQLKQRHGQALLPSYQLIDLRGIAAKHGLSDKAKSLIKHCVDQHEQVLVFLNRRGFAPVLICQACEWQATCHYCEVPFVFHKQPGPHLRCSRCDLKKSLPKACQSCGQSVFVPVGTGTEQLAQDLGEQFGHDRVVRVDRDAAGSSSSLNKQLDRAHQGGRLAPILIGTQMLAKGHHFPDLTCVVMVEGDQLLYSPNFQAQEYLAQLMIQVGGRAGRANKSGSVWIQTRMPHHPIFQHMNQGYTKMAQVILAQRQLAKLPPFQSLALIRARASKPAKAEAFLVKLVSSISQPADLRGPFAAHCPKQGGMYHAYLWLQSPSRVTRHQQLTHLVNAANQAKKSGVHWWVDVDPWDVD
jgi:primosomal protein N' (replication factor Y) (superfamily II helicase)